MVDNVDHAKTSRILRCSHIIQSNMYVCTCICDWLCKNPTDLKRCVTLIPINIMI